MRMFILLVCAILSCSCAAWAGIAHHPEVIVARSSSVIVNLGCGGTVISQGILTAAHCVNTKNPNGPLDRAIGEIVQTRDNGPKFIVKALKVDRGLDLALLALPSGVFIVSAFVAMQAPQVGDDLWFIGYPYTNFDAVGKAYLSEIDENASFNGCVQSDLGRNPHEIYGLGGERISPGNSGGGLFDEDGKLVGVVVGHSLNQECGAAEEGVTPIQLWGLAVGYNTLVAFLTPGG